MPGRVPETGGDSPGVPAAKGDEGAFAQRPQPGRREDRDVGNGATVADGGTAKGLPEVELQWNLSLSLRVRDTVTKVLDQAVGIARPGEVLAVMGPSGAGKTSLLSCLSGRNQMYDGVVALVTEDGKQHGWNKDFARISAYVPQDDMIMETQTCREHLLFQAALKMDQQLTPPELEEVVSTLLEELNLTKCGDTHIGQPGVVKGISGGERKRLSFASRLLGDPMILFVDEPTSGLDSHMANEVMGMLIRLATLTRHRTIVTTVHQAASHTFAACDQLLLLSDGRSVYLGPADRAVAHMGSFGQDLKCPQYTNPADFFLHVLTVDALRPKKEEMCDAFNAAWKLDLEKTTNEPSGQRAYAASCGKQFRMLTWRGANAKWRNPKETHVMLILTVFFALLNGLIFLRLQNTQKGVQSRNAALFLTALQMTMQQIAPTILVFAGDVPMFLQEHAERQYSMTSLFFSKMLVDLPMQTIVPLTFSSVVYFMVGFPAHASTFLYFVLSVLLCSNAAAGMGYVIGCASPDPSFGTVLMPAVVMPNMLLSGFMINLDDIPVYLIPFSYASFVRYALGALLINVWDDSEYDQIDCSEQEMASQACLFPDGDAVLEYLSVNKGDFALNLWLLVGLAVALRVLAFVVLRIKARTYMSESRDSCLHKPVFCAQ